MTASAAPGPVGTFFGALRAGFMALAGLFVVLAVATTALAAALVGLFIAFAAVALRARPDKRTGSDILEGRRTAQGWVVELR